MRQLLILSGKGGTGKTTISSAFIKLSNAKMFADCDVDAPNLHLIMKQSTEAKHTDYYGLPKAVIDSTLCTECGLCKENCRFDAIEENNGYKIAFYSCEGCGVCKESCPTHAISLNPSIAGKLMLYTNDTVFSTAKLRMGSGTSGKLVTEVKKQMNSSSVKSELAIIDGSPGIGCPVIASLSGVDMVLIVAEPTLSGISDMDRIIKTAEKFQTRITVCINKYDINPYNTEKIETFCHNKEIPFVGKIPFDRDVVKAVNSGLSIVDFDCIAGNTVKQVFKDTITILIREI